jgi:3'(2'), 5'-bisphosphate nucleotidase
MISELSQAARRVGGSLAKWRAERKFTGTQQGTQFKAEVDQWAHELWITELQALAPGTPVVSEEDAASSKTDTRGKYWLIDPLDGTASFVGGFTGWVTQVAWMESHRPIAAVVYAPLSDEVFHASAAGGAFLNDRRLLLDPARPIQSLVDNYREPRGIAAATMQQFGISRYLESGSIGLKICRIAAGHADVFVKDVEVKSWDVAPADLVLSEAGGTLTTLDGQPFDYRLHLNHAGLIACHSAGFCQTISDWASPRQIAAQPAPPLH